MVPCYFADSDLLWHVAKALVDPADPNLFDPVQSCSLMPLWW